MNIIREKIKIRNPLKKNLNALEIDVLIDEEALSLYLPEHVAPALASMFKMYDNLTKKYDRQNPRLPTTDTQNALPLIRTGKKAKIPLLVSAGTLLLCLPAHIANQLALEECFKRQVVTPDGKINICPFVGPVVDIEFKNHENFRCTTCPIVFGDEVIFGVVSEQKEEVEVDPAKQKIILNPCNPNSTISKKIVKNKKK